MGRYKRCVVMAFILGLLKTICTLFLSFLLTLFWTCTGSRDVTSMPSTAGGSSSKPRIREWLAHSNFDTVARINAQTEGKRKTAIDVVEMYSLRVDRI